MKRKSIVISNSNELVRMISERVVYVESDGNYSTFVLHDATTQIFTVSLAHCQRVIEEQLGDEAENFIRIGKSLIVNRSYVYKINLSKRLLELSNIYSNRAIKLTASKQALKQLKALLEMGG